MDFSVLIVRLSPFPDVAKSITHQFLYGECRRVLDDSCIDFAFLPGESARKRHSPITSMRFHRPLTDFDLIYISNSFTSELLNLPWLLQHCGIPCSGDERRTAGTKPLIVMGGSNALASQSVLYSDTNAMVDALFFGEGEGRMSVIASELASVPAAERREKLASLQGKVHGLKVFGAPPCRIEKAICEDTTQEQLASAAQFLFDSPEATTARLFIAYDCPSFCTFCFEGWERKPYREVPFKELIRAAEDVRRSTGAETLEITAFNFNTHTDVTGLMRELNKRYFNVNFMSQRADILAANPVLAEYEVASGKKQYTLGVEGISERMRAYFNKNLSEETALTSITLLLKQPIREIKLFYIISGLETEEDNADFAQFLGKVAKLKETYNSGLRILCSFGLLVRMPFTPLRYERLLLTESEWQPVVEMIRRTTEGAGYEFRLTYPYSEYFLSQTLALTNKYCAPVLEEMAKHNFVYDGGFPEGAWDFFKERIPVEPSFCAQKDEQYPFAFDFVDTHTSAEFLYKRYIEARMGLQTPMCLGTKCNGCGACNKNQREALGNHVINMPTLADCRDIAAVVRAKAQAQPVFITADIPADLAAAHEETKTALILRTLFSRLDNGVTTIMTARDTLFGGKSFDGRMTRWYGTTVYSVYPYSNDARPALLKALRAAGFNAEDKEIIPQQITVRLTDRSVTDTKLLEKAACSLLDNMHLPYSISRREKTVSFAIAPKALKKHIVSACRIEDDTIIISGSVKLDFTPLKKSSFTAETSLVL